jgi:chemotaxis protein CheX
MNVRYINPCVNSIGRVFMTMRWVDITFGIPRLDAFEGIRPDVSEMIGFSGDASGSVVPSFPKLVAVKDVSQFAGAELDVSHEDFADAVGELANMAAGGAKAEFDGLDVSNGLSSVIAHPQLISPVKTPFDSFHVCVTMKIEKPAMAGAAS